jgi:hypothetical protein
VQDRIPLLGRIDVARMIKPLGKNWWGWGYEIGAALSLRRFLLHSTTYSAAASAKHLYQYALSLVNHGVGSAVLRLAKRAGPEWHFRVADEPEPVDIDDEEGGSDGDDDYEKDSEEEAVADAEEEEEDMDVEEEGLLPSNWILLRSSWLLLLRLFCIPLTVCDLPGTAPTPPPQDQDRRQGQARPGAADPSHRQAAEDRRRQVAHVPAGRTQAAGQRPHPPLQEDQRPGGRVAGEQGRRAEEEGQGRRQEGQARSVSSHLCDTSYRIISPLMGHLQFGGGRCHTLYGTTGCTGSKIADFCALRGSGVIHCMARPALNAANKLISAP